MAEIISIRSLRQARRRHQEQVVLGSCLALIEQSLHNQLDEFASAPEEERPVRASKIRKLGELLEYTTGLL
ncbi:MAG: hypothetical protein J4F42_05055 [Desulfurellaceae bacterium]|nr:hypothetical protein [Desulfurellaceae bacterium]